ncbi:MAG TPA: hypothetical protein VJX91_06415 [Candidatus Eisenbacteria bacterium]|nr:hypothetical protein [Candidatus Eisenbacteria bacterium]
MTHREDEATEERLVRVADVWDEATATLLCDFLKEQDIPATAVSSQLPAFGMIERAGSGHWGYVEVLEHDEARARELIRDFFAARPEGEAAG